MATTRSLMLLAGLLIPGCSSSSNGASPATDAGSGGNKADSGAVDSGPADTGATADSGPETGTEAGTEAGGCQYPPGPYGTSVGQVVDPTLQWQAFAPNATTASTLKITDFYDCDGTKGINALFIANSAQWCVACQYEAGDIPQWMGSTGPIAGDWAALGVSFLTLVIQTNSYEPATINTAQQWRTLYDLTGIYVAADPGDSFPTASLPHNLLVDPRTMKVAVNLDNDTEYGDDAGDELPDPVVAQLAMQNKK
jgi:hypothetical protein